MADLGLADAMDAAKTLFESIGVPWQVVVHHQIGILQVDTFTCRIGGDQDQYIRVVAELLLDLAASIPVGTTMNFNDCAR